MLALTLTLTLTLLLTADGGVTTPCREKQAICFNPGGNCHMVVIGVMDRALKTLDVAIYALNYEAIVDAMLRAKARGVAVRVIVDSTQLWQAKEMVQLQRLAAAGIPIERDARTGIMHLKTVVADAREFVTGSFNFTHNAAENNDENVLAWECPKNAVLYQRAFDVRWVAFKPVVLPALDGGL